MFTYYVAPHESSRVEATVDAYFGHLLRRVSAPPAALASTASAASAHTAPASTPPPPPFLADFVWVHTPSQHNKVLRESATSTSLLSGIAILENKANLALLERSVEDSVPTLESHVLKGADFRAWCARRFEGGAATRGSGGGAGGAGGDGRSAGGDGCSAAGGVGAGDVDEKDSAGITKERAGDDGGLDAEGSIGQPLLAPRRRREDTWIAKDASANGGQGLFPFAAATWRGVAGQLGARTQYVVQRYVERPLLWEGQFKFHFRVYCVITADLRIHVYRRAFAHVANKPFTLPPLDGGGEGDAATTTSAAAAAAAAAYDPQVHITNVAQNVHNSDAFHAYPVVDIAVDFPAVWDGMLRLLASVMGAATPYVCVCMCVCRCRCSWSMCRWNMCVCMSGA